MDERNLEKALEIVAALLAGEEISRAKNKNIAFYETYIANQQVYELVHKLLQSYDLNLYEYKDALYITAGQSNRTFGYTNEELKRALGIRLNKELYLCYFIIYNIMTYFYHDSAGHTFVEFIRIDETIRLVDQALATVMRKLQKSVFEKTEEYSFKELALLWEDLPILSKEEGIMRAARNSKAGYVKTVFNFLLSQNLFLENQERYYPRNRMRALMENYFEEHQGRLREIMMDKGE